MFFFCSLIILTDSSKIKKKNQEIVTLDLKLTRNAKISLAQEVYNVIMAETV
jgi:hypothetical protein